MAKQYGIFVQGGNNMTEFFQTIMGKKFYERTVPEIAKQLSRIADELELANKLKQVEMEREQKKDRP
jgi:hypothetical protein